MQNGGKSIALMKEEFHAHFPLCVVRRSYAILLWRAGYTKSDNYHFCIYHDKIDHFLGLWGKFSFSPKWKWGVNECSTQRSFGLITTRRNSRRLLLEQGTLQGRLWFCCPSCKIWALPDCPSKHIYYDPCVSTHLHFFQINQKTLPWFSIYSNYCLKNKALSPEGYKWYLNWPQDCQDILHCHFPFSVFGRNLKWVCMSWGFCLVRLWMFWSATKLPLIRLIK